MEQVAPAIGKGVTNALKQLLSGKHLYQYSEVDLSPVSEFAKVIYKDLELSRSDPGSSIHGRDMRSLKDFIAEGESIASRLWTPGGISLPRLSSAREDILLHFDLPTINTFCDQCDDRWPFNPVSEGSYLLQREGGPNECFYLRYQCQQCKGRPLIFLVCREGYRLRLTGRYPLEVLPTPKVIPKSASKYYSNALIAHHAGQTLAGLFLLRVFIEQFWRTVPAVAELVLRQPRATGEEQGEAYQSTLRAEIKSSFPSLKDVYGKLSEAIHTANENAVLFDEACEKIVEHFDARRLYKL